MSRSAFLLTRAVGDWSAEQMFGARTRQEDIDLPLDVIAAVTAVSMHPRSLDQDHILRVVFIRKGENVRVITMYPARRGRY